MTNEERLRKCELRIQYLVDNLPDGDMPAMHPKAVEVARSLIQPLVEIATDVFIYPSWDGDVCLEFCVYGWNVSISTRETGEMNGHALLLKNLTTDEDFDGIDVTKLMQRIDQLRIS